MKPQRLLAALSLALACSTAHAQAPALGSLDISAGVLLNNGSALPMARMHVYLLNADLWQSLEERADGLAAGDAKKKARLLGESWGHYACVAQGIRQKQLNEPGTIENWVKVFVEEHFVKIGTMGFDGRITIDSIPPGKYSVHATNVQMNAPLLWDVPVEVVAGKTTVVLDNANLIRGY